MWILVRCARHPLWSAFCGNLQRASMIALLMHLNRGCNGQATQSTGGKPIADAGGSHSRPAVERLDITICRTLVLERPRGEKICGRSNCTFWHPLAPNLPQRNLAGSVRNNKQDWAHTPRVRVSSTRR